MAIFENKSYSVKFPNDLTFVHSKGLSKPPLYHVSLQQAKVKVDEIRIIGLMQMDREQRDLIDVANKDLKGLEDSKNYAIRFEKQRTIEQV